jgi:flagellar basal body rod protein FlgC
MTSKSAEDNKRQKQEELKVDKVEKIEVEMKEQYHPECPIF